MYPKVYEEFCRHRKEYGYIMRMGSHVFFNGMALGETNKINIEDGKTLVIKYLGLGDRNDDGTRNVQFELNGMRREVAVPDPSRGPTRPRPSSWPTRTTRARSAPPSPAWCPRSTSSPAITVEDNQVLAVIEAMKMETSRRRPHGRARSTKSLSRSGQHGQGRRAAADDQVNPRFSKRSAPSCAPLLRAKKQRQMAVFQAFSSKGKA